MDSLITVKQPNVEQVSRQLVNFCIGYETTLATLNRTQQWGEP